MNKTQADEVFPYSCLGAPLVRVAFLILHIPPSARLIILIIIFVTHIICTIQFPTCIFLEIFHMYVYGKYLVGIVGMKFYAAAHEAVAGSVSAVLARRPLAAPAW